MQGKPCPEGKSRLQFKPEDSRDRKERNSRRKRKGSQSCSWTSKEYNRKFCEVREGMGVGPKETTQNSIVLRVQKRIVATG